MAQHTVNDQSVTISNHRGSVTVTLLEWVAAVEKAGKDFQRPPAHPVEAWARNYWLNRMAWEQDHAIREEQEAEKEQQLQAYLLHCPEPWREFAGRAIRLMLSETRMILNPDPSPDAPALLAHPDEDSIWHNCPPMTWQKLAFMGAHEQASDLAWQEVPDCLVPQERNKLERRFESENSVSHDIALKSIDTQEYRDWDRAFNEAHHRHLSRLLKSAGLSD